MAHSLRSHFTVVLTPLLSYSVLAGRCLGKPDTREGAYVMPRQSDRMSSLATAMGNIPMAILLKTGLKVHSVAIRHKYSGPILNRPVPGLHLRSFRFTTVNRIKKEAKPVKPHGNQ